MIQNLIDELDIKGHLIISKIFPSGEEEVIFDENNIIVSGMGVSLAHLFSLSGSTSVTDFQIDRFQIGVSGNQNMQIVNTFKLGSPLSSTTEYAGVESDTIFVSGHQIKDEIINTTPVAYGIIDQHNITRVNSSTVRYTILIDSDSCNNITRSGVGIPINEIGLFIKNIKNTITPASILVAYRSFSNVLKTSDFSLLFRWSLNF
jgi:hypothetical protein